MVRKVVKPAIVSVRTVVPCCVSLNRRSASPFPPVALLCGVLMCEFQNGGKTIGGYPKDFSRKAPALDGGGKTDRSSGQSTLAINQSLSTARSCASMRFSSSTSERKPSASGRVLSLKISSDHGPRKPF